jgi:hypothetical protein
MKKFSASAAPYPVYPSAMMVAAAAIVALFQA